MKPIWDDEDGHITHTVTAIHEIFKRLGFEESSKTIEDYIVETANVDVYNIGVAYAVANHMKELEDYGVEIYGFNQVNLLIESVYAKMHAAEEFNRVSIIRFQCFLLEVFAKHPVLLSRVKINSMDLIYSHLAVKTFIGLCWMNYGLFRNPNKENMFYTVDGSICVNENYDGPRNIEIWKTICDYVNQTYVADKVQQLCDCFNHCTNSLTLKEVYTELYDLARSPGFTRELWMKQHQNGLKNLLTDEVHDKDVILNLIHEIFLKLVIDLI